MPGPYIRNGNSWWRNPVNWLGIIDGELEADPWDYSATIATGMAGRIRSLSGLARIPEDQSQYGCGVLQIYFLVQYSHRLLGRFIGLVFLLPFLYFWFRQRIRPGLTPKLMIMFLLGGLQGLLGWYMVKSGLVNNPHVSQYRLTAHLMSAILIYGFILWTILDLADQRVYQPLKNSTASRWRYCSLVLSGLLLLTIISGGFVAGLKAGLIFNTFPLMGGQWIPEGINVLSPWYQNLFENRVTVQFDHRILAIVTGLVLIGWYLSGRSSFDDDSIRRSFKLIGMMIIIQVVLGISTLLLRVPVWLGALHQAGALVLFSFMLTNVHALSRR